MQELDEPTSDKKVYTKPQLLLLETQDISGGGTYQMVEANSGQGLMS